jgi:glycosyltransferase involved in cell wall biosynthesis
MTPQVSVITTVKNEQKSVGLLIESLLNQSKKPDEIVIVDGGSDDGTVQAIERYIMNGAPIRLVIASGASISRGRNIGIENACGQIIAATDAGVRLSPHWLRALLDGFRSADGGTIDIVCGFFVPDPHSTFETAMGATVLPSLEEIDGEQFLPSSRSIAFRKEAWRAVGGYPEWLDYCGRFGVRP